MVIKFACRYFSIIINFASHYEVMFTSVLTFEDLIDECTKLWDPHRGWHWIGRVRQGVSVELSIYMYILKLLTIEMPVFFHIRYSYCKNADSHHWKSGNSLHLVIMIDIMKEIKVTSTWKKQNSSVCTVSCNAINSVLLSSIEKSNIKITDQFFRSVDETQGWRLGIRRTTGS